MFTFKVVKDAAKNVFKVKKLDENGNSLGVYDEFFYSEDDAKEFAKKLAAGETEKPAGDAEQKTGDAQTNAPLEPKSTRVLEVSQVEFVSGDEGTEGVTGFRLVKYLRKEDGSKEDLSGEDTHLPGELTVEQVLEKVKETTVENPGEILLVEWSETTTEVPA